MDMSKRNPSQADIERGKRLEDLFRLHKLSDAAGVFLLSKPNKPFLNKIYAGFIGVYTFSILFS